MRVLICGDRDWPRTHEGPIAALVSGVYAAYGPEVTLIQGGARGVDAIAKRYADLLADEDARVTSLTFPAAWDVHDREGHSKVPCRCPNGQATCKAAGPRRNQQMLDEGQPQVVFAFHDYIENSRGTRDMVQRADQADVPCYVVARYRQSVGPKVR